MKKSLLVRLIVILVAAISMSGCVIWPYGWDDGGYHHHHGGGRGWDGGHSGGWDRR